MGVAIGLEKWRALAIRGTKNEICLQTRGPVFLTSQFDRAFRDDLRAGADARRQRPAGAVDRVGGGARIHGAGDEALDPDGEGGAARLPREPRVQRRPMREHFESAAIGRNHHETRLQPSITSTKQTGPFSSCRKTTNQRSK